MNHNHTTAARVALDVLVSHVEGLDDGGEARLYVIPAEGEPVQVSAGPDLYDLLEDFVTDAADRALTPADFVALGLLTFGWAAPIEKGETEPSCAPSEHAARRRVRVVAVVDCAGRMASDLHFLDTGETVTDEGAASGPLADKMIEAVTLGTRATA